ncbi:MAG: hypothetical protein H6608_09995 [Flavobacteriales bacterium]|nr:hypothetical protein [Bacteroidota bacterium]MCB9241454.1 hypothetical protein [Flavobacteriales bacterium]
MVLMALDHTRDFVHITANTDDPMNLATTTVPLFFTRWITHFCAPIFVFLSGTSIYLQSLRKTSKELGSFLIKRGLWLIAVEFTIVALAWTFNPKFNFVPVQVIWAIGISMVILGLFVLVRTPFKLMLAIGVVLVGGHNAFDYIEASESFQPTFWWDLLHSGFFAFYPVTESYTLMLVYPFPAWTGVMLLGYCFGVWYTGDFPPEKRRKQLLYLGLGVLASFVILRSVNAYGDPVPWTTQKDPIFTFLSFLSTAKYPPSLIYLCMTLGPAIILLSLMENVQNKITNWLSVFGKTAFFYYIVHLFLVHLIGALFFFARGHTFDYAMALHEQVPFYFVQPGEGYGLGVVYLVWMGVVIGLYPLCKRYQAYKSSHRDRWWLSYL